jgi:two-component system, LytTR family, response regulator
MAYRILILEDEVHARDTLVRLLNGYPEFTVVGHAATIEEGQQQLDLLKPDLLFSDVMLPPHTSFDLLHALKSIPFEIIFTTSFEEFAIKAFRLAAVDYLLKPVDPADLARALDKFKEKKMAGSSLSHIQQLLTNLHQPPAQARIALPTLTGFLFVSVKDIVRCEADNTYTTFHLSDKRRIIVSKILKECEVLLADYRFFRIHNSHLVNLDFVVEYIKGEGGIVRMSDGTQVDVSRRRKDEFLRALKGM